MIITPKIRGFICTTAHPAGCHAHVQEQIETIQTHSPLKDGPKNVLIIGASTGYGLATRIAASFGAHAKTIGVFFERPAVGKRTASAGWYNTAAFEAEASKKGQYAKSINGDAFSDAIKQQTIDLIKQDWPEGVDLVIYSLASPKRTDPKTEITYSSTLKPIGQNFNDKTVDIMQGKVSTVSLEPATEEEIANTTKVMGGEDWMMWMEALLDAGVLADSAKTVSYSYVGPALTFPIYRAGTIGKAKEDMEKTVTALDALLSPIHGKAYVSVNKGLVTQASSAIPVVPLYFSLLFKVMKAHGTDEGCIEQIWRLFTDRLYQDTVPTDEEGRIRIDDYELEPAVQEEVAKLWQEVTTDNLAALSDIESYRHDFYKLFGFGFDSINYDEDVDADVGIGSI
jgi:enoyl-[acyl-carrier protein] reductase/trans-2-enoyl-CoA reductase (NAD+)